MSAHLPTATDVRATAATADRWTPCSGAAVRRSLVPLIVALVAAVAVLPAGAQGAVTATDPGPRPNAVVQAGEVRIEADVSGGEVRVVVDGRDHGVLRPEGLVVDVPAGGHLVELVAGGAVVRSWRFHAAGIEVTSAGQDPVAVGLAASSAGDGAGPRPVLLANLDQPALSVSLGPLAVATGAVTLPTDIDSTSQEVLDRTVAIAGPGGEVLVLGGLDAVSTDVVGQLEARGLEVVRIGSGTPAQVAAAAAAHRPAQDVYRRDGDPLLRPVLVAPAQPITAAARAAAVAARYGASLVLADGDGLDPRTVEVIGARQAVWLDTALSDAAADAARSAAAEDAAVSVRPSDPEPAKEVWVADISADAGTALLAARAGGTGAAVLLDPSRAADWVAVNQPAGATTVGPVQPHTVAAWSVDGPSAPAVEARLEGTTVHMAVDRQVDGADVHVTAGGREWPGRTSIQGQAVTWTPGPRPQLADDVEAAMPTAVAVEVTAVVAAGGHLRHVHLAQQVTVQPLSSTSPEGFRVAGGSSGVVGTGPLRTFTIEIEPGTGLDLQAVAAEAEQILLDPDRGWTARGQRSMQRVGDPAAADIRVVVATPSTVDRFCGRVGLDTGGRLSCWDGRRAMLNLTRWNTGVAPFHTDLEVYRRYLVSHEVGHGLGYGHVSCPGSGALAPVMMQQSKGLGGCQPNGWPYP